MVLGESLIQRFLTNTLSVYFDNIERDNLSVAVVRGDISLSSVHLRRSVMDHLGFTSLRLVHGTAGSLKARVPWTKFGTAPIVFELDDLFVLVESREDGFMADNGQDRYFKDLEENLKESVKELLASEATDESDKTPQQGGGWGSWLRSAGRMAKRLIDYLEIRIQIRNVHIRYTGDAFNAGVTLDSLSVVTTTQKGSAKVLELSGLAVYCNPELNGGELEDALEDASPAESRKPSPAPNAGRQYIVEPVSGTVTLTFDDHQTYIVGQFDSVALQFTKDQLKTAIWDELKKILISTASGASAVDTKTLLRKASLDSVSSNSPTAASNAPSVKVNLSLGRVVVRSVFLDSVIDFQGEELSIEGGIGDLSQMSFRMRRLNIINGDRRILSTTSDGIDFVYINVVTGGHIPVDITFRLGPVLFDFHPVVVSSVIAFIKSVTGDETPVDSASHSRVESVSPGSPKAIKTLAGVRIQFYWESMVLNWYQPDASIKFASCTMTTSYISLELFDNHFISRGELGDFSIDHVFRSIDLKDAFEAKPVLALARPDTDSYLFKFFVRSFDELDKASFPGHFLQLEFQLSAVKLLVVRSILIRIWDYIFDCFVPGLVGDLSFGTPEEDDFYSVSGDSEAEETRPVAGKRQAAPTLASQPEARRPYLLNFSVDSLELTVPVSVTAEEQDPLSIELHRLTARNQGGEGVIDTIDFDLEEVRILCLGQPLVSGIRVNTSLYRESPIRVVTNFVSPIALSMSRKQFGRLCEVLDSNILANATDGVDVSQLSTVKEPVITAVVENQSSPWLQLDFGLGSTQISIDNPNKSKIKLTKSLVRILKFDIPKVEIAVKLDEVSLQTDGHPTGTIKLVSVYIESLAASRSILVGATDPVFELDLGLLIDLRSFFFDDYAQYKMVSGVVKSADALSDEAARRGADWSTILNANLTSPRIVLPTGNPYKQFYIEASMFSFTQNWATSDLKLHRKFVVSTASVHFVDNTGGLNVSITDNNRLILSNLDLFVSMINDTTIDAESIKLNCEPASLRIGFSHIQEFQDAMQLQRTSIDRNWPNETSVQAATAANEPASRTETELHVHSLSLLVVNDSAVLQNTPLFSVIMKNLESTVESITTLPSVEEGAETSPMTTSPAVRKVIGSSSLMLAVSYFNPSSVAWEPLIESAGDAFVRFQSKRHSIEFLDDKNAVTEKSGQNVFNISDGGLQVNLTEALVQLVLENHRNWSTLLATAGKQTKMVRDPHAFNINSASESDIYFSPYTVKNMTGESRIRVAWREQSYAIENKAQIPLTGVSVLVESGQATHHQQRVHLKITGESWTIPRIPIDRQGTYLFLIPAGDLIATVNVSGDGRKIMTVQSSVIVANEFGCQLRLKLTDDSYETDIAPGESCPIPVGAVASGHFKLKPVSESGEENPWSGSVSIQDIRTRNDSKLWQINAGGRFIYLSGSRQSIIYQDKQVVQLTVTIFAPLRLKSTIPTMVDYQLSTPAPVNGSRFTASGSLSLNGREFVTSVPLTGKLEMKLSFLDGRCISTNGVQIWPIRSADLQLDESNKQFFLPVMFVDSQDPTCTCELKLYYEQVGVKPPELTLHTSQWLVGIDIPIQLQFAYSDDNIAEWASGSPNFISTPRGEKTFVAPLDVGAKKIAAYLNSTRSDRVSVDAVGSTGSITLDAYDDVTKSKVKQDLAVRVSSVPAGTVRDFPVKITTISPKYIVVNTLVDTVLVVRQFGTASGGVTVASSAQVAFKWWTVDPHGSVNRVIQVRHKDNSEWSDRIKVSDIGEHSVKGIEGIRFEVRIYHGGFYIVFSKSNAGDSVTPGTGQPVQVTNNVYQVMLPSMAVSVVGPVSSRNIERAEILLLTVNTLVMNFSISSVANEIDLRMASVQLDDLRDEPKFPVVFRNTVKKRRASNPGNSSSTSNSGAVELFASWLPVKAGADSTLDFESCFMRFGDSELSVDFSLISDLTDMFVKCLRTSASANYPFRYIPAMEVLPIGSLRIWAFKEFLLYPMRVTLSFSPGSPSASSNFSVIHRAISSMSAVERSPLKFTHLLLRGFRASRSNVVSVVAEHYKHELYREMRTIMGSAEAFGNPIGLIGSVSTGVSDLFHEPLSAIREMQGPEDVINVADKTAKGAKSFFKNTAFGVFNSFSKLAATSAQTLSILTEDDEFVNERSEFQNRYKPSHVADGVVVGAASLGRGIISGLSGLVTKPVEGLEQEGIAGLAKGAVKGVGGLFLKPVAGLFDFAKSAAEGVVSSTKDSALEANHVRLPRTLYSHDRSIKVVNNEHSLLKWYLSQLDNVPANFTYCAHVYDAQNGLLVAATATHLVSADTRTRRVNLLVPLWRILGVSCDLDDLVLSVQVHVPDSNCASNLDLELSSIFIVKSVQQLIASAMEI